MQARADLQHTAAVLAAQAKLSVLPPESIGGGVPAFEPDHEQAARMAVGAKAALEAAALVDADPGPLIAALERLTVQLGLSDVEAVLEVSGPAEAIESVADLIAFYRREVAIAGEVQHGYLALRGLLEGLERDFGAAETETARRITARIHDGLEDAANAIEAAKREGAAHG